MQKKNWLKLIYQNWQILLTLDDPSTHYSLVPVLGGIISSMSFICIRVVEEFKHNIK